MATGTVRLGMAAVVRMRQEAKQLARDDVANGEIGPGQRKAAEESHYRWLLALSDGCRRERTPASE